ncbi:MAG TPA: hypothetical protein PK867_18560 [Pirellulales bacterium]|nr:hypothetical protein [Pirellulales bacterium]
MMANPVQPVHLHWLSPAEHGRIAPPSARTYFATIKLDGPVQLEGEWSVKLDSLEQEGGNCARGVISFVSDRAPESVLAPGVRFHLFEGRWPVAEGLVLSLPLVTNPSRPAVQRQRVEPPLASYVKLLVRLHRLIVSGQGEGPAADELRDEMDAPWSRLSDPEIRLVDMLAEDLYRIDGAETSLDLGQARALIDLHLLELAEMDDSPEADALRDVLEARWSQSDEREQELISGLSADLRLVGAQDSQATGTPAVVSEAFVAATKTHDWDRALAVFRDYEDKTPLVDLAAMRGICWDKLGYAEAASVFFGNALQRMPENVALQALYCRSLLSTGQCAAAKANAVWMARPATNPYSSLLAADVLLQCAMRNEEGTSDAGALKQIVDLVERVPIEPLMTETDPLLQSIAMAGFLSARRAYEMLGDRSRAEKAYQIAISLSSGMNSEPALQRTPLASDCVVDVPQQRQLIDSNLMAAIPALAIH